jgi:polyisoprenyl-phosphate glycosyltransferase
MAENHFKLSVIIPCYNEEENISNLFQELSKQLLTYPDCEIIFVDDGSHDKSIEILKSLASKDERLKYISFSRNFGHQNALKAGLDYSSGDCVVSLDADMQHPPEMISKLITKWKEGFDVVYTIRVNEEGISFFKKLTSKTFYQIINFLSNTSVEQGAAGFRLLDRKVVDEIKKFDESYLFIRGIVSWVGFKQISIEYKPNDRFAGTTKYSLKKMVHFASSGITSFSTKPLKISIYAGFIIALIAFIYGLYVIYSAFFTNKVVPGWASVATSVLFIGGLQLIMIGILGEYLGKLFIENKRRPNYIIKDMNLTPSSKK